MSWDPIWDDVFRQRQWGMYPSEALIRFMAHHFYGRDARRRADVRVLELGCGPGANQWYLAREGFSPHGFDGSAVAIARARERLEREGLEADLRVATLADAESQALYDAASFDVVLDVACLQCVPLEQAQRAVRWAHGRLREPSGRMFSCLVAAGSWGDGEGVEVAPRTYARAERGPYAGIGLNRFYTLDEVRALYRDFAAVTIEQTSRTVQGMGERYVTWIVDASVAK
ncbi:MAG: class I SAM-dependent methyltransferase [Myxococcales bacterium]|nr:class I SAM-dependent methyltransferase [Myxococcales bacterium]